MLRTMLQSINSRFEKSKRFGILIGFSILMLGSSCINKEEASLKRWSKVEPFTLTERNGQTISLDDLQGSYWVAQFFYSRCGKECEILGRRMKTIQSSIQGDNKDNIKLVSISVDPVGDTPEYLQYYAKNFGAKEGTWYFLTGDKAEIYDLIIGSFLLPASPEMSNKSDFPKNFIHSEKFAVVDPYGFVRAFFDGMNPDTPQKVIETIQKLKQEQN